jgi:serine/threonine protein kinase
LDLSGQIVDGKYVLLNLLGEGGMGSVYLARHLSLGRHVALKFLSTAGDPELRKRFEREARILSRVKSPHLVRFLGWGMWQEQPYLAMEVLEGCTLTSWLKQKSIVPWNEAFEIGIQACRGLESLHCEQIVHRDLSPANVFVSPTQSGLQVKIIDLGLARYQGNRSSQALTETGLLIGSIHYMSPEVCTGQKADRQSDVYSLGCILYELMSGKKPFDEENPIAMAYKHGNEYPLALSEAVPNDVAVPIFVENIIFRAIQKRTTNRYASAEQFRQDLERAISGDVSKLPVVVWGESASSCVQPGRHRATKFVCVMLLVFVCGIVLTGIRRLQEPSIDFTSPPPSRIPKLVRQLMPVSSDSDFSAYMRTSSERPAVVGKELKRWIASHPGRSPLFIANCYLALATHCLEDDRQAEFLEALKSAETYAKSYRPVDSGGSREKERFLWEIRWTEGVHNRDEHRAYLLIKRLVEEGRTVALLGQRRYQHVLGCGVLRGLINKDRDLMLRCAKCILSSSPSDSTLSQSIWSTSCVALTTPAAYRNGAKFETVRALVELLDRTPKGFDAEIAYNDWSRTTANWAPGSYDLFNKGGSLLTRGFGSLEDAELRAILENCVEEGRLDLARKLATVYGKFRGEAAARSIVSVIGAFESDDLDRVMEIAVELDKGCSNEDSSQEEALRITALYPAYRANRRKGLFLRDLVRCNKIFSCVLRHEAQIDRSTCQWNPPASSDRHTRVIVSDFYLRKCCWIPALEREKYFRLLVDQGGTLVGSSWSKSTMEKLATESGRAGNGVETSIFARLTDLELADASVPTVQEVVKELPRTLFEVYRFRDPTVGRLEWDRRERCYKAVYECNGLRVGIADLRVVEFTAGQVKLSRVDREGRTADYEGRWDAAKGVYEGTFVLHNGERSQKGTWQMY